MLCGRATYAVPGGTVDETPDRAGVGLGADGALMPPVLGGLAAPVILPLAEKVTPPLTTGLGAGFGAGLGADLAIAYSLPVVLIEDHVSQPSREAFLPQAISYSPVASDT